MQELFQQSNGGEHIAAVQTKLKTECQAKSGANWFYWIGALSLISSFIFLTGGRWNFICGLGLTQAVDGIANGIAGHDGSSGMTIVKLVGLVIDIAIAGIFACFGLLANKRYRWAFVVGMTL